MSEQEGFNAIDTSDQLADEISSYAFEGRSEPVNGSTLPAPALDGATAKGFSQSSNSLSSTLKSTSKAPPPPPVYTGQTLAVSRGGMELEKEYALASRALRMKAPSPDPPPALASADADDDTDEAMADALACFRGGLDAESDGPAFGGDGDTENQAMELDEALEEALAVFHSDEPEDELGWQLDIPGQNVTTGVLSSRSKATASSPPPHLHEHGEGVVESGQASNEVSENARRPEPPEPMSSRFSKAAPPCLPRNMASEGGVADEPERMATLPALMAEGVPLSGPCGGPITSGVSNESLAVPVTTASAASASPTEEVTASSPALRLHKHGEGHIELGEALRDAFAGDAGRAEPPVSRVHAGPMNPSFSKAPQPCLSREMVSDNVVTDEFELNVTEPQMAEAVPLGGPRGGPITTGVSNESLVAVLTMATVPSPSPMQEEVGEDVSGELGNLAEIAAEAAQLEEPAVEAGDSSLVEPSGGVEAESAMMDGIVEQGTEGNIAVVTEEDAMEHADTNTAFITEDFIEDATERPLREACGEAAEAGSRGGTKDPGDVLRDALVAGLGADEDGGASPVPSDPDEDSATAAAFFEDVCGSLKKTVPNPTLDVAPGETDGAPDP